MHQLPTGIKQSRARQPRDGTHTRGLQTVVHLLRLLRHVNVNRQILILHVMQQGDDALGGGGTQRLPRLIGHARAGAMILASRLVRAEEAQSLGLAEAVLPDAGFLQHACEWLAPIAAQPPHALFAAKRAILEGLRLPLEQGLALEQRLFAEAVSSQAFVDR